MPETDDQTLQREMSDLTESRSRAQNEMRSILAAAKSGDFIRALTADEKTRLDALGDEISNFQDAIDSRVQRLASESAETFLSRNGTTPMTNPRAYVTHEPQVYTPGGQHSYFRDMYRARQFADTEAAARLRRNDRMVNDHLTRTGLTTVNGVGGEWVPPLWMEEQYVKFARAGRATANICVNDALPAGTDSINIPKIATGTAVAFQGTQNTGINETDLTTTSLSSGVYTVAGGQTISIQLFDQSPLNIDQVILGDLTADYNRFVDLNVVLNGSGSGQPTGILNLSGTTAIANSTTGVASLYSKIANAIQSIQTSRFLPPTHIVMHPRRWASIEAAVDSSSRPLVVPVGSGQNYNPVGTADAGAPAQNVVGYMLGLPVVTDANVPTNTGAGTNQDPVIVAKFDDLFLWEGRIRAEVFPQTYAANGSLYARLYNYVAFQAARYPQSIAIVNGTGQVPPTF